MSTDASQPVKTPGQVAYEAWGQAHGWAAGFRPWDQYPEQIQCKWDAVGAAVLAAQAARGRGGRWDPVPYLAGLLDGRGQVFAAGTDGGIRARLADLLSPYAKLRGGLLLDEPGREDEPTTTAIYRAILTEVRWAPYQEFGIPDPAAETSEPPPGPVRIGATGYRESTVIIYWEAADV